MLPVFGNAQVKAEWPPVKDVRDRIPKGSQKSHLPVSQRFVKCEPRRGRGSQLPRGKARPGTSCSGTGVPEGTGHRERGHFPGRAGRRPQRDTLPSTLRTAQREIRNTNVSTKQHRLQLALLSWSLRVSSGYKDVALSIPQGSFLSPFLRSSSILHSDWPTITSLFPGLLGNRICPLCLSLLP